MKHKILYTICGIFTLMIIVAVPVFATTGTVNTDTLNLRKEASITSSIVELLSLNDTIEILSTEGDWYKIQHGDKIGYVNKEYIKIDPDNLKSETTDIMPDSKSDVTSNSGSETSVTPEINTSKSEISTSQGVEIKTGIISKNIKVRLLPVIKSNSIGTLNLNDKIEIITKTNNWAFIQNENLTGWIPLTAIENNNDTEKTETTSSKSETDNSETDTSTNGDEQIDENAGTNSTVYDKSVTKYVSTSSIYVRSKASTDSDIVTTLIKNTDVTVLGEEGEWYNVKYGDKNGFIRKDLLSDTKVEETSRGGEVDRINNENVSIQNTSSVEESFSNKGLGSQIVSYAKQYLGCPYVYGASGSTSFDCSGFTMYVYKYFGYSLSHSATAQSNVGTYISKENLQEGDLVFFLDYETMDGIGHCGIYIGDGNFIHASSGSGYCVKISTLTSGSYSKRYVTARRLG